MLAIKHTHIGFVWRGCLLLGLSVGAAQAQPKCPVQPDLSCKDLKPPEAMVRMMASGPAESCRRDDNSLWPWSKCKFKVQVVAETKDMPRCWAILPYSALSVENAKRDRTVSWTIDPPVAGHEFEATEGIKLTPVAGSASLPAGTWAKLASGSAQKFRLQLVKEESAEFCHYPQVKGPKDVLCCPADPVIANDP